MDLESEVRTVMRHSQKALTVDQVANEVAESIKGEIRSILNTLVKGHELTSVHGIRLPLKGGAVDGFNCSARCHVATACSTA